MLNRQTNQVLKAFGGSDYESDTTSQISKKPRADSASVSALPLTAVKEIIQKWLEKASGIWLQKQ
ncbi:hypothetical protein K7432_011378 [Basidiobolus ranarum]|uniref:Uncharacterized protein n=1 Tax=Basidiobolus ranarum TaxID=34480 RepID=A0ABR2VUY5_9FUNG